MNSTEGRSIRLFLADGTPHGLIITEIINWTGKVLSVPRGRMTDLLARPEARRTGLYLLLGPDPDRSFGQLAYIGETDEIGQRLRYHLSSGKLDFFDRVAVIVSSDDNLTKAHVRYVESQLIRLARQANKVALANDREPDFQRLPEPVLPTVAEVVAVKDGACARIFDHLGQCGFVCRQVIVAVVRMKQPPGHAVCLEHVEM